MRKGLLEIAGKTEVDVRSRAFESERHRRLARTVYGTRSRRRADAHAYCRERLPVEPAMTLLRHARPDRASDASGKEFLTLRAVRGAAQKKEDGRFSPWTYQSSSSSADGETRTHTGQRPLPPQSSVSTISPRPQYFGTANLRRFIGNPTLSRENIKIFPPSPFPSRIIISWD